MGVRIVNPVQERSVPQSPPLMTLPNFDIYGPLGAGIASAGSSIGEALAERGRQKQRAAEFDETMKFLREQLKANTEVSREEIRNMLAVAEMNAKSNRDTAALNLLGNLGIAGISGAISLANTARSEGRMMTHDLLQHELTKGQMVMEVLRDLAKDASFSAGQTVKDWEATEDQIMSELNALDVPGNLINAMSVWGEQGRLFGIPGTEKVFGTAPDLPGEFESKLLTLRNRIEAAQAPKPVKYAWMMGLRNRIISSIPAVKGTSLLLTDEEQMKQARMLADRLLSKLGLPGTGEDIAGGINYWELANNSVALGRTDDPSVQVRKKLMGLLDLAQTGLGMDHAAKLGAIPREDLTPQDKAAYLMLPRVLGVVQKYLNDPKSNEVEKLVEEFGSVFHSLNDLTDSKSEFDKLLTNPTARDIGPELPPPPTPPTPTFPTTLPSESEDPWREFTEYAGGGR